MSNNFILESNYGIIINSQWVASNSINNNNVVNSQVKSSIEIQPKHKRVRSDAHKIPK